MKLLALILLLPVVVLGPICFGQSNTATIFGSITDASGSAAPAAVVRLQNIDTNEVRSTLSALDGSYKITFLPVGTYDISVTLQGFQTVKLSQVKLDVGQAARLDFTLQPGAIGTEITVTGETPLINAANAELGTVVDSKRVEELPLNGRSIMSLITLQSGTAAAQGSGRFTFQFNGVHSQGTNFTVDGTDATRIESQTLSQPGSVVSGGATSVGLTTLSLDAVQEFRVSTGILPASAPRAAGGIINVITKSGTNSIHGSLAEYYRGNSLNAGNWFANAAGRPAGRFVSNQWGVAVGGPVVKDRLFYFSSYEGLRIRQNSVTTGFLPTKSFINTIEDPVLRGVLLGLPAPDTTDPVEPRIGLRTNVASRRDGVDLSLIRLDWQASSKDRIFARLNLNFYRTQNPGLGPSLSSALQNSDKRGTASWTRIISPTMTNEFRFGENHNFFASDGVRLSPLGNITIGGAAGAGGAATLNFSSSTNKFCCKTFTWADNFNLQRGSHSISAGFEIRRTDPLDIPFLFPPFYTFASLDDLQANRASVVTFIFGANTAPGNPNAVGYIEFGPDQLMQHGYYIQDDWKVTRRLTLNLGLRYDYFPPTKSTERKPCCSSVNVVNDPFGPYRKFGEHIANPDRNDFAPRFGFAYDLTGSGKTVVRGGYGIMRAPFMLSFLTAINYLNPGVSETGTLLRADFPNLKFPFEGKPPLSASNRNLLDPNFHAMYVQTVTLTLEQALPARMVFRGIFTGNHSLNNQWSNRFNVPISPNGEPQFPRPGFGLIRYDEGSKQSKYNSLQLNLQRRFAGGHGFDVFYTWSHGIDNIGDSDSQAIAPFGNYQDVNDHKAEKATNSSDIRHQLLFDYIFELRFASWAKLHHAVARRILDGWAVNGLTYIRSGLPVSIRTGRDIGNTLFTQRPNLVPDVPLRLSGRSWNEGVYNSAAYAIPTVREAGTGYLKGNLGRATERGPDFVNFDISAVKNFTFRESHQLQFRFEFFNLLNHVNFSQPGSTLALGPAFGRSTSAFPARQVQIGGRYTF